MLQKSGVHSYIAIFPGVRTWKQWRWLHLILADSTPWTAQLDGLHWAKFPQAVKRYEFGQYTNARIHEININLTFLTLVMHRYIESFEKWTREHVVSNNQAIEQFRNLKITSDFHNSIGLHFRLSFLTVKWMTFLLKIFKLTMFSKWWNVLEYWEKKQL